MSLIIFLFIPYLIIIVSFGQARQKFYYYNCSERFFLFVLFLLSVITVIMAISALCWCSALRASWREMRSCLGQHGGEGSPFSWWRQAATRRRRHASLLTQSWTYTGSIWLVERCWKRRGSRWCQSWWASPCQQGQLSVPSDDYI